MILLGLPLGPFCWAHRRLVALGAAALVAMGAAAAVQAARFQSVHLVNGFAAPVTVTLGSKSLLVPARGRAVVAVPLGVQRGRAVSQAGEEVDRVELTVRPAGLLVWNIAGAAPVFRENVEYWSDPKDHPPSDARPDVFCGQREISVRRVDDAFTDPPEELDTPSSESLVLRTHVDVLPVEDSADPADFCVGYLASEKRASDAERIAELSARLANRSGG